MIAKCPKCRRPQAELKRVQLQRTQTQLAGIELVCMDLSAISAQPDMWSSYITSTQKHVSDAGEKIAFDRFHVAKHLGDAVDKVRRSEHKELVEQGSEDLKGTRYLWLHKSENLRSLSWEDLVVLRRRTLKTAQAWAVKKMVCGFRNRERFRRAILIHLGGLDLYPASVVKTSCKSPTHYPGNVIRQCEYD